MITVDMTVRKEGFKQLGLRMSVSGSGKSRTLHVEVRGRSKEPFARDFEFNDPATAVTEVVVALAPVLKAQFDYVRDLGKAEIAAIIAEAFFEFGRDKAKEVTGVRP